jgi:hypothetical protein
LKRKKPTSALLEALRNNRLGKIARSRTLSFICLLLRSRANAMNSVATASALSRNARENDAGERKIVASLWPTNAKTALRISATLDRLIWRHSRGTVATLIRVRA